MVCTSCPRWPSDARFWTLEPGAPRRSVVVDVPPLARASGDRRHRAQGRALAGGRLRLGRAPRRLVSTADSRGRSRSCRRRRISCKCRWVLFRHPMRLPSACGAGGPRRAARTLRRPRRCGEDALSTRSPASPPTRLSSAPGLAPRREATMDLPSTYDVAIIGAGCGRRRDRRELASTTSAHLPNPTDDAPGTSKANRRSCTRASTPSPARSRPRWSAVVMRS